MSAKRTSAPVYRTALAVATKLREGTIASSPGPRPTARQARCRATVALETASAWRVFTSPANSVSKAWVTAPMVSQRLRSTSCTAFSSASSKFKSAKGTFHIKIPRFHSPGEFAPSALRNPGLPGRNRLVAQDPASNHRTESPSPVPCFR